MRLARLEIGGFKSFAKKTSFVFDAPVTAVVGPNGSGKSNVAEACRWVLGEQSLKSLRGRRGEDFIWHGSLTVPRAGQAAVSMVFNNTDGQFPLEAAEVVIRREVERNGSNNYFLNGSTVRLKDLNELLHRSALGASGYHIISQGEADKVLISNPIERRQIVETSLGLRFYEWQLEETKRKINQTNENLKQVELLRREIAPHLRFLKKEMEKIEKTREWRRELKDLARVYFKLERDYLDEWGKRLAEEMTSKRHELETLELKLKRLVLSTGEKPEEEASPTSQRVLAAERSLTAVLERRQTLARELGRLEGLLEAERELVVENNETVGASQVRLWAEELEKTLGETEAAPTDWPALRGKLKGLIEAMRRAVRMEASEGEEIGRKHQVEHDELTKQLAELEVEIKNKETEVGSAKDALRAETAERSEAERFLIEARFEKRELESKLEALVAETERRKILEADYERELAETVALTDRELLDQIKEIGEVEGGTDRTEQAARQRQIERRKMQLESAGVGSGEVANEYEQTRDRADHLEREVGDLEASIKSLEQVAKDLKEKIDTEFRQGLKKINEAFQEFFQLLFGGGKASLSIVEGLESEEESESAGRRPPGPGGLEIEVSLPRKRIKGLEMLSGGERSLTSIALLFALSRVHPPPFMVLDETDAALDEANSRKYGDMVEQLAKETQLILITHNRETMSRAGIIYGVTMGNDGVSKLLSVKFDEAVTYAKA